MASVLIPGPEGKVEADYTHGPKNSSRSALILHPDPSRGGTMHTKVSNKTVPRPKPYTMWRTYKQKNVHGDKK